MRGSTAGLADAPEGASRAHRALLAALDTCFSCTVVAPAVVAYWRGTWNLSNIYIYEDSLLISSLISVAIGCLGHIFLMLTQSFLKKYLHPDRSRLLYYVGSRFYTYVFGIVSVNSWRGPWRLLELLMGHGGSIAPTWVSLVALAALRCLRNITAPPFGLVTDRAPEYFDVPTVFRVSSSRDPLLFTLDCLFSVVVVGSLVVFVWRGAWDLLDAYLFPSNPAWSAWGSFVLGYGLALVTFLLQPGARRACTHLTGARRLLAADLFLLLSFTATINVWRSVWSLLDIYFLPEDPLLSNWITHGGCLLLLMLLNCANSVLVRGVYIDAEEEGGKCVVFPCYYLRLFFQKERVKKRRARLEKAAAAAANSVTITSKNDLEHNSGSMPLLVKVHPVTVNRVSHIQEKDQQLDPQPNIEETVK